MKKLICMVFAACLPTLAYADIMTVTLLGTGTPRPEISRFGPAVLVEAGRQKLLFDAGRGVAQRLSQIYTPYREVDKVFITHAHYDHIVGLPDLFLSGWVFGRHTPLRVWGGKGIAAHTADLEAAYRIDIDKRHKHVSLPLTGARFDTVEIKPGTVYEHDGLRVEAIAVDHGPAHPAFAYRVEYSGRVLVISGDTRYSASLSRRAKGADLLIHELAVASESLRKANENLRRILATHTDIEGLSRVLNEAKPRMTLLTHVLMFDVSEEEVMSRVEAGYTGDVRLADDLTAVDVGERLRVYRRPAF